MLMTRALLTTNAYRRGRGRFDSTDSEVMSLNISNNKLGPAGAKIIADAIKVRYVHAGCVQVLRRCGMHMELCVYRFFISQ
jgi:hypothetical protein